MKFIHRLGYYLGGFAIGLIFLMFFLSGKKASCAYGPEARVLKNIGTKQISFTEDVQTLMQQRAIDSTTFAGLLRAGDVNFKDSNTKLDSCKVYAIESEHQDQKVFMKIRNCEAEAVVFDLKIK